MRSSVNRIALGTIIGEQPWREMLAADKAKVIDLPPVNEFSRPAELIFFWTCRRDEICQRCDQHRRIVTDSVPN